MNKISLKVTLHSRNNTAGQQRDDICLNAKDVPPALKEHGVVEVNQVGQDFRLLLQVKTLNNELPAKGTLSLENSVATYFQFRNFSMVEIAPISTRHITLELVELAFRDQYFSRNDYFRFMNAMRNTVVYTNKKIEFLGCLKCVVIDMWMRGERVSSGFVGSETKIIFRSSTAVVHIFLQISEEMWDFDYFGDVYFEKAVSGFLTDLFERWVKNNCSHDVTIVLFSRVFYEANVIEDFPLPARQCLLKDWRGRFYEDYFRVIIQNERYTEEWTSVLARLKSCFHEYRDSVLNKHSQHFSNFPKARLSSAAEGNFLETLNLTLNLYQNYNIDRNFDRTGKICVIITPGAGVFEVDRGLFNGTKERVLALGVGADLVCLGTQPLHAVPLFTFSDVTQSSSGDVYNVPHWLNHSFYRSKSELAFRRKYNFVPRINLQFEKSQHNDQEQLLERPWNSQPRITKHFEYDEHDANAFAPLSQRRCHDASNLNSRRGSAQNLGRLAVRHLLPGRDRHVSDTIHTYSRGSAQPDGKSTHEIASSTDTHNGTDEELTYDQRVLFTESSEAALDRPIVGSADGPIVNRHNGPRRALLNPFAPNRLNIKMTANRRRWAHVFPTDKTGGIVQLHHQNDSSLDNVLGQRKKRNNLSLLACDPTCPNVQRKTCSISNDSVFGRTHSFNETQDNGESKQDDFHMLSPVPSAQSSGPSSYTDRAAGLRTPANSHVTPLGTNAETGSSKGTATASSSSKRLSHKVINSMFKEGDQKWLWGPLGEQEASPITPMVHRSTSSVSILIGVDWKSLITPALMPITTDYFPTDQSLYTDFLVNNYGLDPSAINSDAIRSYELCSDLEKPYCRKPMTPHQVFDELIHQRLGSGYQLVVPNTSTALITAGKASSSLDRSGLPSSPEGQPEMLRLSQGRLFHILCLTGECINVLIYRPRVSLSSNGQDIHYQYRLMVPDALEYAMSSTKFSRESSENFTWNRLDNYICTRGEGESFASMDSLKFWRSRFFLLPAYNHATKKLIDLMATDKSLRFDIYESRGPEENRQLLEGMAKFGDIVNKFRRVDANGQPPNQSRKSAKQRTCSSASLVRDTKPMPSLKRTSDSGLLRGALRVVMSNPASPIDKALRNQFSFESMDTNRFRESAENSPVKGATSGGSNTELEEELSCKSSYVRILTAMMTDSGVTFISCSRNSFPPHTFVACDAVSWMLSNISDIDNDPHHAISLMKDMLMQRYIVHASGNTYHPFVYGFYFYSILSFSSEGSRRDSDVTRITTCSYSSEVGHSFQLEWTEVAFPIPPTKASHEPQIKFLAAELPTEHLDNYVDYESVDAWCDGQAQTFFSASRDKKILLMELESTNREKITRPEWVTWQYASNFDPSCAFDLELRWLVATGGRLSDIISVWKKKASQLCNLHLLPVPCNQFALPDSPDCDPLRGPIFIHLDLDCLSHHGLPVFNEFPTKSRTQRLALFQETILLRFGFLSDGCYNRNEKESLEKGESRTYVHCTGGMFAMIPDYSNTESRSMFGHRYGKYESQGRQPSLLGVPSVTRRHSFLHSSICDSETSRGEDEDEDEEEIKDAGFIWAWNYMLTKRWRSPTTGDEQFQDRVLADFRAFCANQEGRLEEYWNLCQEKHCAQDINPTAEIDSGF